MKRFHALTLAFVASWGFTAVAADTSGPLIVELTPAQGQLESLLAREVATAARQKRTPFVELGATWCGPCKALAKALDAHDPLMDDAFAGTYIIRLDLDQWKAQLPPLGFNNPGVPVFFAVGADGHAMGSKIDGGAWAEDTPANMAPPLKKFFLENGRGG